MMPAESAMQHATARPSSATPAEGSFLGFDFGLRRTGVAVGELLLGIAHPLETLAQPDRAARFARIGQLVTQWRPVLMVVGMPTHPDGGVHELAGAVERFARQLEGRFGLPVCFTDETLSSDAASRDLAAQGIRGRRQKPLLDQAAAREILQSFFESLRVAA